MEVAYTAGTTSATTECTAADSAGRAIRPTAGGRRENELAEEWRSVRRPLLYVQQCRAPIVGVHARAAVLPMPAIWAHFKRVYGGAGEKAVAVSKGSRVLPAVL